MSFLFQPIRGYEFTSPVVDHIKNRFLWIKPVSSIILANPKLRIKFTRREINDRIVETPFVLGNLPPKGKILDVGACESPIALMLATHGYKVWANDTRTYPFEHPNLTIDNESVLKIKKKNFFDMVICLSVLEHIGLEVYGNKNEDELDKKAVQKMHELLKRGGKLILTTPIDRKHCMIYHSRVYTLAELKKYLDNFSKIEISVGYKNKKEEWNIAKRLPTKFKSFGTRSCAVALIIATK